MQSHAFKTAQNLFSKIIGIFTKDNPAVARNGGAAIRIVKTENETERDCPGFKAGRAVSWEVDMTKATNVDMVEDSIRYTLQIEKPISYWPG